MLFRTRSTKGLYWSGEAVQCIPRMRSSHASPGMRTCRKGRLVEVSDSRYAWYPRSCHFPHNAWRSCRAASTTRTLSSTFSCIWLRSPGSSRDTQESTCRYTDFQARIAVLELVNKDRAMPHTLRRQLSHWVCENSPDTPNTLH